MRILIVILSFVNTSLFSNECENGFIEINNYCYFEQDIQVLNQFIFNSNLSINPTSLGEQVWDNGRLLSLCYSMYEIDGCLQSIPLSGSIPENIYLLDELVDLRLLGNDLFGYIPEGIGQLVNLEYLDLSYNNLFGSLPNTFGNLSNLTDLYISNNSLNGNLNIICELVKLENFYAFSNQFIGSLSSCFANLENIEVLILKDNLLTNEIPSSITTLSKLGYLDISNNEIVSLPSSINEMVSLNYLYLNNNSITNIPYDICDLNIDWTYPSISSIRNNYLCENDYYPDCLSSYLGDQICDWYLIGDTDLNNQVNINDIILLIETIILDLSLNEFEYIVSDVYKDSSINILDVINIVHIIFDR